MLTREELLETREYVKNFGDYENVSIKWLRGIIDSHIAALDEIERLKAEVVAKDKEVQHYMGQFGKLALEHEMIGKYPTGYIVPKQPQSNTTGNLLIPRREAQTGDRGIKA